MRNAQVCAIPHSERAMNVVNQNARNELPNVPTICSSFHILRSSSPSMQSNDESLRQKTGHWRCPGCKPGIIYCRGSGGNQHSEHWQCCQCNFALNSYLLDEGCSSCLAGFNAIDAYAFDDSHDPFDLSLGFATNDPNTSLHVACFPESIAAVPQIVAADDLASTIQGNLVRFGSYERQSDPSATFDYNNIIEDPASANILPTRDVGTNIASLTLPYQRELHSKWNISSQLPDAANPASASNSSAKGRSTATSTAFAASNVEFRENEDSAYGSLSDPSRSDYPRAGEERSLSSRDQDSTFSSLNDDTSIASASKRSQQSEFIGPRLACPFYKRNPSLCRRNACAGKGYESISRLRGHLEQAHLCFRCERCQAIFPGKKGAKALNDHRRMPEGCAWRPEQTFWGMDQTTRKTLSSRKGIQNKTREERWSAMYMLLFPEISASGMPSPCK